MFTQNMADNIPLSKYINVSLTTSKVCRLCGSKDGPFLNIFGPGMDLAKKIEDLLLILVKEWDDLPHKICFRCSAKVADFHEFLEKCVKTQETFSQMLGKDFNYKRDKSNKLRNDWEAKLNKNKLSNDEYCDELVKKALESVASLTFENSSELQNFSVESKSTGRKCPIIKNTEPSNSSEALKKLKIKLNRVDCQRFPGVEKRNGKFFIVDVKKKTVSFKDSKIEEKKNVEVSPKKDGNRPSLNSRFESIQESLKKFKTEIKKKQGESPRVSTAATGEAEPKSDGVTIQSNDRSHDKVSENFTIVKVAGVGPVYTCKFCDHLLLEKHRMYTHKCLVLRSAKENPPRADQTQTNVNKRTSETPTANHIGSHDEKNTKGKKSGAPPPASPNTPTTALPSQRKRKSESGTKLDEQTKQTKVNTPPSTTLPELPPAEGRDPAEAVPQVPNKLQIIPDKPAATFNIANIGNTPPAELLSKSFYLVPMGNNSYSLQATPQVETNPTFNKPVNTSFTSSENSILPDKNKTVVTSAPVKKPKEKAVSTVKHKNSRIVSTSFMSSENSILPDSNKIITTSAPVTNPKEKAVTPDTNKNSRIAAEDRKGCTSHKQKKLKVLHSEENTAKIETPNAPYPVGLLCRNNSNGSAQGLNDQTSAQNIADFVSKSRHDRNEFPQYTILPPKTPGKIVIATVPSVKKKKRSSQESNIETSKKRSRKQKLEVTPDSDLEIPILNVQRGAQSEHFFTYVNLDPMLKPAYVLPTQTLVQEPQISTTNVPISRSSSISSKAPPTECQSEIKRTKKGDSASKYVCSICDLEFSREKKLFAHVKSHYQGFYNDDDD